MKATTAARFYWKCRDCLTAFAVDGEYREMLCACGGRAWCMGRVCGVRLTNTVNCCPCDRRCTGAPGPSCDCSCGGENHGSGRLVPVVVDAGPVPVATVAVGPTELARATEYRAAIAPLVSERDRLQGGGWLSQCDYERLCELIHTIACASQSKDHHNRMRLLQRFATAQSP